VASNDPRNFAVDLHPSEFEGRNGWLVVPSHLPRSASTKLLACFATVLPASNVIVSRSGRPDAQLTIWRGTHYRENRCNVHGF
jgi:hypothetical protein